MAYKISEEGTVLLSDISKFCKRIKEDCRDCDSSGEWPKDLYETAFGLGYHTLEVPGEYGGLGLCNADKAALLEEMAAADAGFAVTIAASGLALRPVLYAGSEEQKRRVCGCILEGGIGAFCMTESMAGSDAGAGKTSAVKAQGGYILNGRKCFITNGSKASFYCVTAAVEPGTGRMSMFLAEAGTRGLTVGMKEDKMGIRASDTCEILLEDCYIPEENLIGEKGRGFSIAMEALTHGRAWMGVAAAGLARRAMEEAISYGAKRFQFGAAISEKQAIQLKIADMAIHIETARQMNAYALELLEQGSPCRKEAAMAKCYSADTAFEAASQAVQILGGYGYSRDYPVEKLLRDAKIFQIFEGTNEILRLQIAKEMIAG